VTTIETLCSYEGPTGGFDLVKMGKACITAHHHIKTEDGWMTARQAAERGHVTLSTHHAYPKLFSLYLNGGGNIIISTSATLDKAPTQIEAATMGYRLELSTDPQQDGCITYPLHEGSSGEHRTSRDKPSYCCVAQRHHKDMPGWPTPSVTPLVPRTAQLEPNTVTERANRENKGELKKEHTGLPSTSQKDFKTGQRQPEEHRGDLVTASTATNTKRPVQPPILETCCSYSPHLALSASLPAPLQKRIWVPMIIPQPTTDTLLSCGSTTNQETVIEIPKPHHNPTHEPQLDIYLQTPTGEHVSGYEVQWEPNPYALACGDTSGLLGIIPGHYHLWASAAATTLCTLARSDLRSQFYKTPPNDDDCFYYFQK